MTDTASRHPTPAESGRLAPRRDERDETVARVLADCLAEEPRVGRALVCGPHGLSTLETLTDWAPSRAYWSRTVEDGAEARPWPDDGPFDAAVIRLPRGKESLAFAVDAAASVLPAGAPVYVGGANDEGIRSASRLLEDALDEVGTLSTRRHCRVLRGRVRAAGTGPGSLDAWRQPAPHPLGLEQPWITYPGLFAGGALDEGTATLLEALPRQYRARRVLDFGCGAGVVSASLAERSPLVEITALDHDALAVLATRENVPSAEVVVGASLAALGARTFHRIVSNPPIHSGKAEHFGVLRELVAGARRALTPRGELWIVVQRQVPAQRLLSEAFRDVVRVAASPRFAVWRAR